MPRNTTLAALFLVNVGSLLATPAAAQNAGCTGDFNCSEPRVVATWPLEPLKAVRKVTAPAQ